MRGATELTIRSVRSAVAVVACAVAMLLLPAAASADTYVDAVNGDDSEICLTPATACQTIGLAVILRPTVVDTVHVESGSYGGFNLPRGVSVIADDFNANNSDPPPVITGDSSNPAVRVQTAAQPPGRIEGFVINGPFASMDIADSITVEGNVFNEDAPATRPAFPGADVHVTGGTVIFRNNTFGDPLPIDNQMGIALEGGSVTIEDNDFDGFREAIDATGLLGLTITGNTITSLHQADVATPPDPPNIAEGFGIAAIQSSSIITRNLIHQPAIGGAPVGIFLFDSDELSAPTSNAVLRRNRVFGLERGLYVSGGGGTISLDGDLIANNSGFGVAFSSGLAAAPLAISNATIYDNGLDIELFDTALTMDSSAIGDPITAFAGSTCAITNSRGPTTTGTGCQTFQTNAMPGFVNPSVNDFHLLPTSALVDAGNPVAPPGGSVDIDGDARAIDGNCDGTARRDIGADEATRDCVPPETTIDAGPSGDTDDPTPTFGFSSSDPGSTFQCALDAGALGPCSGPGQSHTAATLSLGAHTFRVVATDPGGNADPTAAERAFTVVAPTTDPDPPQSDPPDTSDKRPPETTSKGPRRKTRDRTPTFTFGADEAGVGFQCRLDNNPFSACDAKRTFRVRPGRHSVAVFAIDLAGNADSTPAMKRFKVVKGD